MDPETFVIRISFSIMAYLHCRTGHAFLHYADFSIDSDSDSDPLIEMYVMGMEICSWDGDMSLRWVITI